MLLANIMTMLKVNAKSSYEVVVPDEVRAKAYVYIKYLVEFYSLKRYLTLIKHGKQLKKRTFNSTIYDLVKKEFETMLKLIDLTKVIDVFIDEAIKKYPHVWFLHATDVFDKKSLLTIICDPPQITHSSFGQLLTPDAYINVHFIPTKLRDGRIYRSLISRFFYTTNYPIWKYKINYILNKYPALKSVFNQTYNNYFKKALQKGLPKDQAESFAKKCARRDCIRVFIGNAWLIQTYFLYKEGIVKTISVPTHLINHVNDLINPSALLPNDKKVEFSQKFGVDIEEINWYWLYKIYKEQKP